MKTKNKLLSGGCTVCGWNGMVSLISLTALVVVVSQYLGMIKYNLEKRGKV